jgi:hypothetical protein
MFSIFEMFGIPRNKRIPTMDCHFNVLLWMPCVLMNCLQQTQNSDVMTSASSLLLFFSSSNRITSSATPFETTLLPGLRKSVCQPEMLNNQLTTSCGTARSPAPASQSRKHSAQQPRAINSRAPHLAASPLERRAKSNATESDTKSR